ncbi:MAG: hypothetical protein NVV83_22010 [Afipia sp.]|nr:hypothetical protein [Afipia sp.]
MRDRLGWNFKEENLRALFLTHRLIARKAGYEQLWSAYNQRGGFWQEQFQGGEDPVSRFLCDDIDALIEAWTRSDQGSVITILNKHRTIIASRQEKERVSGDLNRLIEMTNKGATIGDVLGYVRSSKLMPILDQLAERLDAKQVIIKEDGEPEKDGVFFAALFAVPFKQVTLYRAVLERNMPYSTKHGVKGDEFDTVFVVLDDAGANWSQYSFSNLLAASDTNEARVQRTRNLFYVCCSRAKRNLAVIDLAGVGSGRATIEALFGAENCMF